MCTGGGRNVRAGEDVSVLSPGRDRVGQLTEPQQLPRGSDAAT